MKILSKRILGMSALLMTFAFQNCSGVHFSSTPTQNNGTNGTDGAPTGNNPGGGGSEPPTTAQSCTPTSGNIPIITASQLPATVTNAQLLAICPAVHDDTGCGAVIIFASTGAPSLYFPTVNNKEEGPYDGNDDTLVGVLNLSSTAITQLAVGSDRDIFNFDGDGIDTYGGKLTNTMDSTGYGGDNAYYTNSSPSFKSGTVNFISPVAAGTGTTYFGLENALTSTTSCLTVTPN